MEIGRSRDGRAGRGSQITLTVARRLSSPFRLRSLCVSFVSGSFGPALSLLTSPPSRSPTSPSSFSYLCPLPLVDVHALPSVPLHHPPVVALAVMLGDVKIRRRVSTRQSSIRTRRWPKGGTKAGRPQRCRSPSHDTHAGKNPFSSGPNAPSSTLTRALTLSRDSRTWIPPA
jgi:hypothetical protein